MIYKRRVGDRKYVGNKPPEPPALKYQSMELFDKPRKQAVCDCCTTTRTIEDFPYVSGADIYVVGENGRKRATFCMYCCVKFCERMEKKYGNQYKALYRLCAFIGLYYDDALAHRVWEEDREYENGERVSEFISPYELYIRAIQDDPRKERRSFMDEDCVPFEYIVRKQRNSSSLDELSEADIEARNSVIEKFHKDPFQDEPVADRGRLYADLVTMYDDAMAEDLVKQNAAIEIVKSFYRAEIIGRTIQRLQSSAESIVDNSKVLKELAEQKDKEIKTVTQFSKDHGFAQRYATAKSKGAGTLSSVVRDGKEKHFDRLAVNKFDIETSNAMQQVADISFRAIQNQVQFTTDDYRKMVEEQAETIKEMRETNAKLQEANRLLREKQIKQELIEEYVSDLKAKKIEDPEILRVAVKNAEVKTYYSKDGE